MTSAEKRVSAVSTRSEIASGDGGDRLAAPVALAGEQLGAEPRRGLVPVGLPAQHMGGVGRREAGDMDQPARHQPGERGVLRGRGKQPVDRLRHVGDRRIELGFRRRSGRRPAAPARRCGPRSGRPCGRDWALRSCRSSSAMTASPCENAASASGTTRRGPSRIFGLSPPSSSATSESPPSPKVRMATASTMVRKPPTVAPSGSSRGRPLSSTATSVVVPPMSETTASSSPVMWRAPTRLAAGPDRMVSIGRCRAKAAETSAPSPRTTISGAAMPRCSRKPSVAATSRSIIEISRALSSVVSARRGPPSLADSSWLAVTGRPVLFADQLARGDLMRRVAHGEIGADGKAGDRRRASSGRAASSAARSSVCGIAVDVVAAGHEQHRVGAERGLAARRGRGRPPKSRS